MIRQSRDLVATGAPIVRNQKHKRFADEYLSGKTATDAALAAGYTGGNVGVSASRLLKQADVASYIEFHKLQQTEDTQQIRREIIEELRAMAFSNIDDFITVDKDGNPQVDFTNATREQLRAITSVQSKHRDIYAPNGKRIATEKHSRFTLADKYRGLELLGKEIGMFKQADQTIVIDVADRLLNARRRVAQLGLPAPEQRDD